MTRYTDTDEWRDTKHDARRVGLWGLGTGTLIVIAIMMICAIVGAAVWLIGVATSDVAGRGEQRKQINSAQNRTFQQEYFERQYEDIQALDANLDSSADALASSEKSGTAQEVAHWRGVLAGQQQQCRNVVAEYDARARQVSAQRFRAADLPAEIDQSDSLFDCQPGRAS